MDRLLLGDNPFFGINHMSEEKARAQALRFQDTNAILEVLDIAQEAGIRTLMCTTHDRIAEICDAVRADPVRAQNAVFFPCMPYAHKYANAVTDHGMMGAIAQFMPQDGLVSTLMRGGSALATKDVEAIARILIDMEMKMFRGLNTPVVFLQNVFADLLLGLGLTGIFRVFHDHVRDAYGAEAGFITMNLPAMLDALNAEGIENPIICANINKIGFRMCGGIDRYVETLQTRQLRAVAMSVYASGAIPADDAIAWIADLPNIQSIVFGASRRTSIFGTRDLVCRHLPDPAAA